MRSHRCIQWGIARRADDQIIGTLAFFQLDFVARKVEIGFALGSAHWGKGYMHQSLQAALGYAFNDLDLRRIEADVDPRNLPSVRLLERLGFQKEGCLRERWLVDEETQDALFYGLLKRKWNSAGVICEVGPAAVLARSQASGGIE